MILGLMSSSEFETAINIRNPLIRRPKSITDIAKAVGSAHQITGKPAQFIALLGIRKLCSDWKAEHTRTTNHSWKLSPRGQGVHALELEIAGLFTGSFQAEYQEFRRGLGQKVQRAGQAFSTITGVGDADRPPLHLPGSTRSLSGHEYVLEFLEPKHRGNAAQMKTLWDQSSSNLSFTDFVNSLPPEEVNAIDEMNGKVGGQYKWVKYLDDSERAQVELKPIAPANQFKRDMDSGPFDTTNMESEPGRRGWSIFVMDERNRIYTHSKSVKQFHHSSFLGGRPTKSAGTLKGRTGAIVGVSMASGHYAPGPTQALAICRALLAKFAGTSGMEFNDKTAAASQRAQQELAAILICPDFQNATFYNALEYLKAGANMTGLTSSGPPA